LRILGALAGVVLIVLVLLDTFETILQPRRVTHRFRFARFFYRWNWALWTFLARRIPRGKRREAFLALFGPLSLLALFLTWGVGLILGFALLHASAATALHTADSPVNFLTYLYLSGTTFFTLGYGDVTPADHLGRVLAVIESGLGFAFLAVVISYLPGITQAFSRRETTISLMDARAGSPPTAAQVLIRVARADSFEGLQSFLVEWEQWSAELLESHLSFPVLIYFRSQHDNQSWLAALTCMLDTTALLMAAMKDCNPYRAQLTFAMARHAAVDLAVIFRIPPRPPTHDRLPADQLQQLHRTLREAGLPLRDDVELAPKLAELRAMYEPFLSALADKFLLTLPPIAPPGESIDNWQRSPGMPRAPGIANLPLAPGGDEHFG
jgi:voltage-gated potassium channel Kch